MCSIVAYKNDNLKKLIKAKHLTIEALANKLGLSVSTINRLLLSDNVDPKLSTLRTLAHYFGVSLDELVGDQSLQLEDIHGSIGQRTDAQVQQVPILYWEQVAQAQTLTAQLSRPTWEHWVAISEWVGTGAFALRIQDRSLPKPFYFNTTIVVDPGREMIDGDFALALYRNKPILCHVVTHGLDRYFRLLNIDQVYPEYDAEGVRNVNLCGPVVQWTTAYQEGTVI